ncbi:ROK family protein [Nonomuraea sp. NPDC050536]|uniref:ROK family transcriptional regulator n=1 Tax=Nonomuraea sp. NPDC050536 TaxID=3364366 RepID=UPI0037C7F9DF
MAGLNGDPSVLRKLNSAAVLRVLHSALLSGTATGSGTPTQPGSMTLTEITKAVNVSRPTVEDVVESLLEQGLLNDLEPTGGTGRAAGRPARRFGFRADAGHVVGVDVAPDWVHVLTADLVGTIVASHHAPVSRRADGPERLEAVRRAVAQVLDDAGRGRRPVLGAAVATTGIVDAAGRVVLSNLPGWTGVDLSAELGDIVGAPIVVENDMRAGAAAERWIGAAMAADNVVYLHAGLRMGTGFLIDGRIPKGHHGGAGELTRAGGKQALKAYRRLLDHLPPADPEHGSGPDGPPRDVRPLFEAAARHEPAAESAAKDFARRFVKAVEGLIVSIDPEVVVVGGSLALAGDIVAEPIRNHLAKACVFPPRIEVSGLGDDSVAQGAIRIALDQVEAQLFLTGNGQSDRDARLGTLPAGADLEAIIDRVRESMT